MKQLTSINYLNSESFSPQRISGIAREPESVPEIKKLKGFLCLGHFSPRLGVSCVVRVSPGLSFAIDHSKWNIGFLFAASVFICGRNTLRMPASPQVAQAKSACMVIELTTSCKYKTLVFAQQVNSTLRAL